MGLVLVMFAVMLVAAFFFWIGMQNSETAEDAFLAAARELGLLFVPDPRGGNHVGSGRIDGFEVRIERSNAITSERTVTVAGAGRIPIDFELHERGFASHAAPSAPRDHVRTGDHGFDARIRVAARPAFALAALNAEARRRVLSLSDRGSVQVARGLIEVRLRRDTAYTLVDTVRQAVQLAPHLCITEGGFAAALARNVEEDPVPGARIASLALLLETYPRSAEVTEALSAASADPDARVRLNAALGMSGEEVLELLTAIIKDDALPVQLRAEALDAALKKVPYGKVSAIVAELLDSRRLELRRAAVRAVGVARDATLFARLHELARSAGDDLVPDVATAIGDIGEPWIEPALIEMVQRDSNACRAAAARVLAQRGSIAAVEPMLRVAEDMFLPREVTHALRDAVRAIQERAGDVEAGRLSLVSSSAAGGLSLVDSDGRLSVPKREAPKEK